MGEITIITVDNVDYNIKDEALTVEVSKKVDKASLSEVATTGSYNDLEDKPYIPAEVIESTIGGWGFTKNTGTVTGVKINGSTKSPSSGVVDLGTVITAHQDISGKADKNNFTRFSTDEQRIGTWIDGKPIYRKTLIYSVADLTATKFCAYYPSKDGGTEMTSLNIDSYVGMSGVTFCANQAVTTGAWQPIPRVCPDANESYNIGFGDLKPERVGVLFGNKYLSATVYLTIEYTKTTD